MPTTRERCVVLVLELLVAIIGEWRGQKPSQIGGATTLMEIGCAWQDVCGVARALAGACGMQVPIKKRGLRSVRYEMSLRDLAELVVGIVEDSAAKQGTHPSARRGSRRVGAA